MFNVTVNNASGTATTTPRTQNIYSTWLTGEAGIRGTVDTGPIGHEFALSATTLQQDQGANAVNGTAYATTIYDPLIVARPNLANPAANKTATSTLSSLAIADTLLMADKRIQLTLGGRLQQVKSTNYNVLTGAQTSSYDQSALTPSVALVVKPWSNVSLYGNFIQGLQQGIVVGPAFTNAGEIFAPYMSTQFEVGVKVDWGKLTTTASLFQITQPSILTNVTNNTQYLGGEQRNQGLELNFFGEPIEGVRLLGGAMFLDAVLTKTQGGATNGWTAPMAPRASSCAWRASGTCRSCPVSRSTVVWSTRARSTSMRPGRGAAWRPGPASTSEPVTRSRTPAPKESSWSLASMSKISSTPTTGRAVLARPRSASERRKPSGFR